MEIDYIFVHWKLTMQIFGNSKKNKQTKTPQIELLLSRRRQTTHLSKKMRAHVFLFSEIIFEENLKATLRSKQTLRSNERRRQKITCSKRTNEMALLIYPEEASLTGQFCFCIVVFNPLLIFFFHFKCRFPNCQWMLTTETFVFPSR